MDQQDNGNAAVGGEVTNGTSVRRKSRFFLGLAVLLVVVVAVGFAKSFYLREVGTRAASVPPLPATLIVHGVALTGWYLLFPLQALLVAVGRRDTHRTMGMVGAVWAAAVFGLSGMVVFRAPARDLAMGVPVSEISLKVIGDIGLLLLFATLVTLSIRFRGQPDVHKRLMAAACITIAAPAIARWPGAQEHLPFSVAVPQLLLFGSLVVHDIRSARRPHRATLWATAAYVVVVGVCVPLAFSEAGQRFVASLG